MRYATVRPGHPHWARIFPVRPDFIRIDIRASARILTNSLLYLFKIGVRPEIH